MQTIEAIKKRISVRKYKNEVIPREYIEKIIDCGRSAPTARRVEPWEFVVIEDKKILALLSQFAPNGVFIKEAACCIAVFCQDTKYYLEDGCAATENILLACVDLGLGACWVAGDKKDYVNEIARNLKAPANMKLVSLISVGWPAEEPKQVRNRSLKEVIHWGEF